MNTKENKETDAPMFLRLSATGNDGGTFGELIADAKDFATGSCGFFVSGKLTNPKSGARYQVTANVVLIGSGPEKKGKK